MFYAGNTTKLTGLTYRQLDNVVRNRHLYPSCRAACGRGTVRRFSQRDLVALRLAKEILGAGHDLGPFMHILRFVQRGRRLPPIHKLESTVLVSNGRNVRIVDRAKLNLSPTLEARSVVYVVNIGAAAGYVRERIERLAQAGKK